MGISDAVKKLEDIRQKIQICRFISVFLVIVVVADIFMHPDNVKEIGTIILISALLICVLNFYFVYILKIKFKRLYKETFVRKVLEESFQNVIYMWECGLPKSSVEEFGLTPIGDKYISEDYIKACYRDIEFEQADVKIIKQNNMGRYNTTITYFKGRMFSVNSPSKSPISLQIFSKRFIYRGTPVEKFKMHKIELEDMEFNNMFDVFSVDEHEAFYILTPPMMERIKTLEKKYYGFAMHFTHGKLYVGIPTVRDAFDSDMSKKIDYAAERKRMQEDVQVIKDIIDMLIQNVR